MNSNVFMHLKYLEKHENKNNLNTVALIFSISKKKIIVFF